MQPRNWKNLSGPGTLWFICARFNELCLINFSAVCNGRMSSWWIREFIKMSLKSIFVCYWFPQFPTLACTPVFDVKANMPCTFVRWANNREKNVLKSSDQHKRRFFRRFLHRKFNYLLVIYARFWTWFKAFKNFLVDSRKAFCGWLKFQSCKSHCFDFEEKHKTDLEVERKHQSAESKTNEINWRLRSQRDDGKVKRKSSRVLVKCC